MAARVKRLHRDPDTGRFAPNGAQADASVRQIAQRQSTQRQAGAIPYRLGKDGLHFLLITSRGSGRWIFPKGGCNAGETAACCAAREAFEEAGLEGRVVRTPVGAYRAVRSVRPGDPRRAHPAPIDVQMYAFEVTREHDGWPEKSARRRRWATLTEARKLIGDPNLVALAERAAARIMSAAAPVRPARRAAR